MGRNTAFTHLLLSAFTPQFVAILMPGKIWRYDAEREKKLSVQRTVQMSGKPVNKTITVRCVRQHAPSDPYLFAAALLSQGELSESSAEQRFSGSSVSIRSISASAISGIKGPYSSRTRRRYDFFGLTAQQGRYQDRDNVMRQITVEARKHN